MIGFILYLDFMPQNCYVRYKDIPYFRVFCHSSQPKIDVPKIGYVANLPYIKTLTQTRTILMQNKSLQSTHCTLQLLNKSANLSVNRYFVLSLALIHTLALCRCWRTLNSPKPREQRPLARDGSSILSMLQNLHQII